MNYPIACPIQTTEDFSMGTCMRICFSMIDSADMVAFLPDWQQSAGARLEHDYCAYTRKTRVFPWGHGG